jgi:hypothetical protein
MSKPLAAAALISFAACMWLLTLALLAANPVKVVAPTFSGAGVPEDKVRYFTSHFAARLRAQGVDVVSAEDIAALLGVERQRELLGCQDGSSACLVELANALGTNATARGSIALIGGEYRVDVTVLNNSAGVLAEYTSSGTDERGVLDALEEAASKVAQTLAPRAATRVRFRARSVVPAVLGVLVATAGGILLGEAASSYNQLMSGMTFGAGEGQALAARGGVFNAAGWVGLGVGAAALVLGIVLFVLDRSGP